MVAVLAGPLFAGEEVVSRDKDLSSGRWTALAARYPLQAVSGDITGSPDPEILADWWNTLGDPTLTELIMLSLRNNRDLTVARSKVTEARAALGISKAAVLPWLDSSNYWNRGRTPAKTGGASSPNNIFRLGVDASWEIDIFGGRRQTVKAGKAMLEAQYASLHAAWVTLSSEVAINYITLRTLQERLRIAEENITLQQDMYDILKSRVEAGLSDQLALQQSSYTLEQTKAAIPPISVAIEEVKNGLAILTGEIPGSLEEKLGAAKAIPMPDTVGLVGIPANALRQRPDILAAERQLVAQIARKKSAQADLWPKFYLFGSIGTESLDTGSLFSGASKIYSFGPRITWPIFHWGAIRNNIRVQTARQEQFLAAYEQTVLKAVGEVRNALTALTLEKERGASLKRGVDSAKTALEVANDKYKSGLTDFNNVISAQRALLTLSESYAVSEGQRTSSLVRLYKALGGGWAPMSESSQERDK